MNLPQFLKIAVSGERKRIRVNETTILERTSFDPIDVETSAIMAKALGLPYKLLLPPDGQFGRQLPNGTWTGMIGMVQRDEADMVISTLALTEERSQAVPFSYPYATSEMTFVTEKPEYVPHLGVLLDPFSTESWISIAVCLVFMSFVFYFFSWKKYSAAIILISTLSVLLHQNLQHEPKNVKDYFLLSSWMIGATFLSSFYSAVLLSFLSFPTLSGIRTIPDLSAALVKDECWCATYPGGFIADVLLNSNDPSERLIGQNQNRLHRLSMTDC